MSGGSGGPDYDVLIVGAGPAGCAASICVPRGTKALLVDRGDPGRGRCCGGLLAPDAQAAISRLGLELPSSVRVSPEPRTVRVRDLDSGAEQTYRRRYANVDRARFDGWLVAVARERAEFRPRTRLTGLVVCPDGVAADLACAGRDERVTARVLIGADGARSLVRKLAFPARPKPAAAVAIQVRLTGRMRIGAHKVVFASKLTDFYAWAIPKALTVLVGSAFDEAKGARARFETLLAILRRAVGLEGEVVERSARPLSRPHRREQLFAGEGPVLLAGEAAGLVSPSSGEGISFAVESGAAAGRAACAESPAAAYERAFRRQARRVARKFVKARVIFSPRLRRLAMLLPWCP